MDVSEMKIFNILSNSESIFALDDWKRVHGVSLCSERETTLPVVKAPKYRLSVSKGVSSLRHREG